ncbi:MAG TPA: styrene monooxygenase/indole monooxygenase family protein [Xanthobacteraceae bacterium]|nr:styrene monooxygenase/indole monooxygenase family protein [Xanthobacteraceae bacterium]
MSKRIGILGAGVAGLHLGLLLRKHGIDATIITDRPAETLAKMPLLNTVAHHHVTLEREAALGIRRWRDRDCHYFCHHHHFGFPEPIVFQGDFASPSRAVDYRLYLPALMQDFASQDGDIEIREVGIKDLASLAARFDLLVVSTGKGALGQIFPHLPERSPYDKPQRRLCVGLYTGVADMPLRGVTLSVSPGHGELIEIPTLTFGGMATALLMENVPGGDLEELSKLDYKANPKAFLQTLLQKLERHHPAVHARIDTSAFDLCQPIDLLQGGIVPTVRQGFVPIDDGKFAIAVGDVHSVVDPMMGQGANVASYSACVVGENIVADDVFDERFCEKVDRAREDRVLAASRWTNMMLGPPSEHLGALIYSMSQNRRLANEFTENFNFPERQWDRIASPARIKTWLAQASQA